MKAQDSAFGRHSVVVFLASSISEHVPDGLDVHQLVANNLVLAWRMAKKKPPHPKGRVVGKDGHLPEKIIAIVDLEARAFFQHLAASNSPRAIFA